MTAKRYKKQVKLFTQSYREAKESGLVDKLLGIGIVSGSCFEALRNPYSRENIEVVNKELIKSAQVKGADYVFGIDYTVAPMGKIYYSVLGTGDAYKKKS